MLTRLHLTNFKNFADATLDLGPFTVLVGTNASGKSNLRDALRFLHGIGRGYSLAEIVGRKYSEAGELQWSGIRGGVKELARLGSDKIGLFVCFRLAADSEKIELSGSYGLAVHAGLTGVHHMLSERFWLSEVGDVFLIEEKLLSYSLMCAKVLESDGLDLLGKQQRKFTLIDVHPDTPVLTQIGTAIDGWPGQGTRTAINRLVAQLSAIRFLEPDPEAMRRPAVPGAIRLGDRGENLSAVLMDICRDPAQKQTLMAWLAELTPMDVVDFEFPSDLTGAVLAVLIERNGRKVSAYSASDGTLRFLAILAALLGRERGRCYFIEELDNGLHPARLHLLVELIERQTAAGHVQVIASTHSPQLLELLSPESREHASLIYRLPDSDDAQIVRIADLPNAREVLQHESLAELHVAGWLENAAAFGADPEQD